VNNSLSQADAFVNASTDPRLDNLKVDLKSRRKITYGYCDRWILDCCCCFKRKLTRKDKLGKEADRMIKEEKDILNIVKKLRINSFMSSLILKPTQTDLVNFFDEYKMCSTKNFVSRRQRKMNIEKAI
jgi:hypothetical protein